MKHLFIVAAWFLALGSVHAQTGDLKTVDFVDPGQYLGTWYQAARNPLPFERGCVCSRQVLGPLPDGKISVYNSCNQLAPDGQLVEIRGFAINDDPSTNSKFTVDFNVGRLGKYWIIGLDSYYRYAVVSDPSRSSLYILSKTPHLDEALYQEAIAKAGEQLDTSKLIRDFHDGCIYPSAIGGI